MLYRANFKNPIFPIMLRLGPLGFTNAEICEDLLDKF